MRFCVLLSLVCVGCLYVAQALPVQAAPVQPEEVQPVSCGDASALGAAGLAVTEINKDRKEGYAFSLYRLSNVNKMMHGDTGVVFYLTLDVVETECHVLSKDWRNCEPRPIDNTPVYGQCKATIYVNRVQRVVRLYRYNCVIRPVQAVKVADVCPDCPSYIAMDDENIQRTVKMSLEKFNKESNLTNRFALLNIARATYQGGMMEFYHVEYTIQETSCKSDAAGDCPLMTCEFAHKGFCKASLVPPHPVLGDGVENMEVDCAIYEPEAAEEEKRLHLSAEETDHTHDAAHAQDHTHDVPHSAQGHAHDHAHDHTKSQHPHDHHDHGHAHGPAHDHVHAHHAKAHNHSGDLPNQHHQYDHGDATHTHEHDHELALDHDHQHAHLHVHEHHHHHHEPKVAPHHHHPEGTVRVLPAVDRPMTLPSFPDQPAAAGPEAGVTLPLIPDPQIPGEREPTILPFPSTVSALECPGVVKANARNPVVLNAFASDPMFNAAA